MIQVRQGDPRYVEVTDSIQTCTVMSLARDVQECCPHDQFRRTVSRLEGLSPNLDVFRRRRAVFP